MRRHLLIAAMLAVAATGAAAQQPAAKPAPTFGQRKYNSIFPVNTPTLMDAKTGDYKRLIVMTFTRRADGR